MHIFHYLIGPSWRDSPPKTNLTDFNTVKQIEKAYSLNNVICCTGLKLAPNLYICSYIFKVIMFNFIDKTN